MDVEAVLCAFTLSDLNGMDLSQERMSPCNAGEGGG